MVRVGVIGLGMMGMTHLDVYSKLDGVEVVAISDINPDLLHGRAQAKGNIDGQAKGLFDFDAVKKYDEGKKLIRNKSIDLVDVCLTTQLHMEFGRRVLRAGKHVMVEKPVARTWREAKKLVAAAEQSPKFAMVGQCMRFWPQWVWLKNAIDAKTYGRVLSANFRRTASHPGGNFYLDGDLCGGALLDLHVHDIDFIQYCFGQPNSVRSIGDSRITNKIDHIITQYEYDDVPIVVAEGSWMMTEGYGFEMQFTVNFERGTAIYDLSAEDPLKLIEPNREPQVIDAGPGMGYEHEIAYFINCINNNQPPSTVTVASAAMSVKIAEAEQKSAITHRPVKVQA